MSLALKNFEIVSNFTYINPKTPFQLRHLRILLAFPTTWTGCRQQHKPFTNYSKFSRKSHLFSWRNYKGIGGSRVQRGAAGSWANKFSRTLFTNLSDVMRFFNINIWYGATACQVDKAATFPLPLPSPPPAPVETVKRKVAKVSNKQKINVERFSVKNSRSLSQFGRSSPLLPSPFLTLYVRGLSGC